MPTSYDKIIKDYNHELSQLVVDQAKYEIAYEDEIKDFDLLKYLEAK